MEAPGGVGKTRLVSICAVWCATITDTLMNLMTCEAIINSHLYLNYKSKSANISFLRTPELTNLPKSRMRLQSIIEHKTYGKIIF